ncbi:MAG: invasion associated locus B family protein [Pseudomonadota bacterium]
MIRHLKLFVLPALLGALAAPITAQAQEQEVRATHGSWQILCLQGTDACAMQQVGKSAQGEDALVMRISRVEGATSEDGQVIPATAEIIAPLGVILSTGLRVQVDGGQVRATGFQICLANGCLAQDVMSEKFVNDMKGGSTAKVLLVLPQQGEVSVNLSLSGFTKAFNSLKPLQSNR